MSIEFGFPKEIEPCTVRDLWKAWYFGYGYIPGLIYIQFIIPIGKLMIMVCTADDRITGLYWFKIKIMAMYQIVDINFRLPVFYLPVRRGNNE